MNILFPVFAMALLTFAMGTLLLTTRISSVKSGILHIEYYEVFQGGEPPPEVLKTTRHMANLFEAPILFYIACLMAYSIQMESALLVGLAWAYVAVRMVHTIIHLTYNRVYHRLSVFLISQAILIVIWALIFIKIV